MNKKQLSERDICTKYITPALEKARWDVTTQVREEFPLNKGRIIVRGKLHTRAKHKRADYVLFYKPNIPIAIIEAKDNNHRVGDGMQQAFGYADMLQVPFEFSSNGDGFLLHNKIAVDGIVERELALHEFPAAETLWQWWARHRGLNDQQNALFSQDYFSGGSFIDVFAGKNGTGKSNLFEFDGSSVVSKKVRKADVNKSLSAGLISFSESDARLNIHYVLKNTTGAVLFTEGIADEMILETAWAKLFQTEERNFEIQNAFSCGFLCNLVIDNTLYQNHTGRTFFSVFDFDEAYNDWNQLGQNVQTDPCRCLVKKHNAHESFTTLLPVPDNGQIRNQIINPHTGGNYFNGSLPTIELLFHGVPGLDQYFVVDTDRTDGFIKFVSDGQKAASAKDVVPALDPACFEVCRPTFEFVKSKCPAGAEGDEVAP